MNIYEWVEYGAVALTFTLFVFAATFWGRELGRIGYWYWGIASLFPIGIAVLTWYLNSKAAS